MENIFKKYLEEHKITPANFSRMIKCNPSACHKWVHGTGHPNPINAWKIHKITKGEVPITFWGFTIIGGKTKKISKRSITLGDE